MDFPILDASNPRRQFVHWFTVLTNHVYNHFTVSANTKFELDFAVVFAVSQFLMATSHLALGGSLDRLSTCLFSSVDQNARNILRINRYHNAVATFFEGIGQFARARASHIHPYFEI